MLHQARHFDDNLPLHQPRYRDSGHYLTEQSPDAPVFLFSANALRLRSRSIQAVFPGTVSYAVKANPEERVIRTLVESGINHFDVASLGEIALVSRIAPAATMHYNNPIKTREMVETAYYQYGVKSFAVDDLPGLAHVVSLGAEVEVSVRFRLPHGDAAYDFGSKFGADPAHAVDILQQAASHGLITSMTFHPGSQCTSPSRYHEYIHRAAVIAREAGVRLHQLNVGGGFPVSYAGRPVAPLVEYMHGVDRAARQAFGDDVPALMCEPGRAMVADCCSLLTRVIHVRDSGEVYINDGVYGAFQEQSLMNTVLPCQVWRDGARHGGENLEPRTVFGPTCDPVDRLRDGIRLPADIQVGDYVEFFMMGAYGSATSTSFNGFEPAGYIEIASAFTAVTPEVSH